MRQAGIPARALWFGVASPTAAHCLVMQAESQDGVWYNLDCRPSRPCTIMQFGTLELMRNVWTPFECYISDTNRHFRPLCVPRCFSQAVALLLFPSTTAACASTAGSHTWRPIAVVATDRLAVVLESQSVIDAGHNLHMSLTSGCKSDLVDIDKPNGSNQRQQSSRTTSHTNTYTQTIFLPSKYHVLTSA